TPHPTPCPQKKSKPRAEAPTQYAKPATSPRGTVRPLGPRGAPPRPLRCWDPPVLADLSGGRCRGGRAVEEEKRREELGEESNIGSSLFLSTGSWVSTGLHLAFEDERINSTTSASTSERADASRSVLFAVGEHLNTQLQQQREEIEQFFKMQGEQARQLLEEKRQRHLQSLIAAIEEGVSRRLQEKDLEVEKMKRQNSELAEHVKQVSLEAHHWQNKARTYEAMATALRTNLQQAQQAVAFSREQSKEGCGDSEADDAASSHHGDMDDAHARTFKENRELREQRTCRVCRCNDVSILLLPCRHLCLCKECESRLDACPLCRSLKNASVQVYMS
ncbi:unnamed protein product, partial [Sphagnum compactum]